jgi:hypothetical protein
MSDYEFTLNISTDELKGDDKRGELATKIRVVADEVENGAEASSIYAGYGDTTFNVTFPPSRFEVTVIVVVEADGVETEDDASDAVVNALYEFEDANVDGVTLLD